MNILFALPSLDDGSEVAAYLRDLMHALVTLGHDAAAIPLRGILPAPGAQPNPQTADDAARVLNAAERAHARLVIARGVLPVFAPHADALAARAAIALAPDPSFDPSGIDGPLAAHPDERALFTACARIVATNEEARAEIVALGIDPARVRVVVPGVTHRGRAANGDEAAGRPCHVLSVGALVPRMGHDVLIAALARLTDLAWRLTIIGHAPDPDYAARLYAQATANGRVTILPPPSDATMDTIWDTADLFALAIRHGSSTAIGDALARGLPICVADGGIPDTAVPPGAGIVAPADDVDQLSKAMRRLMFSAPLRASFATAAAAAGASLPGWLTQAALFADAIA